MIVCLQDSHVKTGSINMSTRSFIGFVTENGEFTGNYCHYDGYPEHVGKILVEHHNSFSAAEAIAAGPQIRNFDHDGTICRFGDGDTCLLYTSPSPRDGLLSRMPSSA